MRFWLCALALAACCPPAAEPRSIAPRPGKPSSKPFGETHGCVAPPRARPAAARPLANLAVARRFKQPVPTSYLRSAGDHFVGFAYADIQVYSPAHEEPIASWPNKPVWTDYTPLQAVEHTNRVIDGAWLPLVAGGLVSVGQLDGKVRWRSALYPDVHLDPRTAGSRAFVNHVARDGAFLLASFTTFMNPPSSAEVIALDWNGGKVAWRAPSAEGIADLAAADGRAFVLYTDAVLRAFDLASGTPRWETKLAAFDAEGLDLPVLLLGPKVLVLVRPASIDVIDVETGSVARTIKAAGPIDTAMSTPHVDGCTLFAQTVRTPSQGRISGVRANVLTAIDLGSGERLWEANEIMVADHGNRAPDLPAGPRSPLFSDAHGVFTCLQDGALRAYDRDSGELAFHTGLAFGCEMVPLPPDGDGARSLVVRRHDGAIELLSRAAAEPPTERANIHVTVRMPDGQPWDSSPVIVDGRVTFTDDQGEVDVTLDGRSVVMVTVATNERWAPRGATVVLDGRATPYPVAIDMKEPPPLDF